MPSKQVVKHTHHQKKLESYQQPQQQRNRRTRRLPYLSSAWEIKINKMIDQDLENFSQQSKQKFENFLENFSSIKKSNEKSLLSSSRTKEKNSVRKDLFWNSTKNLKIYLSNQVKRLKNTVQNLINDEDDGDADDDDDGDGDGEGNDDNDGTDSVERSEEIEYGNAYEEAADDRIETENVDDSVDGESDHLDHHRDNVEDVVEDLNKTSNIQNDQNMKIKFHKEQQQQQQKEVKDQPKQPQPLISKVIGKMIGNRRTERFGENFPTKLNSDNGRNQNKKTRLFQKQQSRTNRKHGTIPIDLDRIDFLINDLKTISTKIVKDIDKFIDESIKSDPDAKRRG
ncbi:hypothetical protein QR98_0098540 [Sarcoptes scabiei]|uniref:Uncharacterized protein n=1 Tax=Sarcoptes scabiei TaxID=52283 RepID=A0A132AJX5_SARSC|nr:hypothetical protein QR98_0098540 [Sarcoptes scabiei]